MNTEARVLATLNKIEENLDNDLYLQANPVEVNLPLPFEN